MNIAAKMVTKLLATEPLAWVHDSLYSVKHPPSGIELSIYDGDVRYIRRPIEVSLGWRGRRAVQRALEKAVVAKAMANLADYDEKAKATTAKAPAVT